MTIKNQQKLVDGENLNLHHGVSGFYYKNLLGQFCVVAIIWVAIFGILIHQSYADEATLQGEDSRCRIKINGSNEYIDYEESYDYSSYYESDKYDYGQDEPNKLWDLICSTPGYFFWYGYSNTDEGCMATMWDDDIYINYQDTNSDYSSYYKSDKYQYGENEPEQWWELRCSTPGEFLWNGYEYPQVGSS